MSKKEKIKNDFINSPRTLSYYQIQSLLHEEGFEIKQGKGSHTKITHKKTGKAFIVPIHDGDCKGVYKEELKKFYLSIVD